MGYRHPKSPGVWLAFFGMGLLNNVIPFVLIVWGQSQIASGLASGLASVLNATTPLFTVIVAGLMLHDENITWIKLVGVAIGFVGVLIMIGVPVVGEGGNILAQVAVLIAGVLKSI